MSWPKVALGELVQPISKWNPSSDAPDEYLSYIDIASVDQERKQVVGQQRVLGAEAPSRARQLVEQGDVLVSTVRPNLNAVAFVGSEHQGATASTGFSVLRASPKNWMVDFCTTGQSIHDLSRCLRSEPQDKVIPP